MKKIIILAALALMTQACTYSGDKDLDENPRHNSVHYLTYNGLLNVFWAIDLADFFDRYQDIREDRDAAVALGLEYFGTYFRQDNLVYESYRSGMGNIMLTTTPGLYKIESYTGYNNMTVFYAEVSDDRRYHITTKAPRTKEVGAIDIDFVLDVECTATVTPENIAVIENLDLRYEENPVEGQTTAARITSTPDAAKIRLLCQESMWSVIPFTGALDFSIGGDLINDEFSVKYSEDKYDII